jgi:hypothetical protein
MRRAAAGVAAVVALAVPAVAHATTTHDAALARKGIALAVTRHWIKAPDAYRYRVAVTRAVRDAKTLAPLKRPVIAAQLSQLTPMWSSYTAPRALTLFSQLETNLDYLETNRLPTTKTDVTDDEGVVYRWFPRLGLEFHPLANFGALNNVAAKQDAEATGMLAAALLARGVPRGDRLIWEYQFRYAGGRPPWASGMAQAVAAQAFARAYSLLQDPDLRDASVRAYASVAPFFLDLPSGPWIRLYGFNGQIVLNAQLQTILSLLEYANTTGDEEAVTAAQQLTATTQLLFPRFDTGDWSRYQLGGAYASREYQKFVTDILATLARKTQDPFWLATSQRFHAYFYDPPLVTPVAAPAEVYPLSGDGTLPATQIAFTLSMRATVTLTIAGKASTYRLGAGRRTIAWEPPPGTAAGSYPVRLKATSYAGHSRSYTLPPVVIHGETTPPVITSATFVPSTLSWAVTDESPTVDLAVDLLDPTGAAAPQTIELGAQPTTGSLSVTLPPGTWQATLRVTSPTGLSATFTLGTFTTPG